MRPPELARLGEVFTVFAEQDSGNVSYGVQGSGGRLFVKTAGDPSADAFLGFDARVALLRNAVELARSVAHPSLPTLHEVVESPSGPLLVYSWRDGMLLGEHRERFRALPTDDILRALDELYEVHDLLDAAGWVEGDFYDGSMLYDVRTRRLTIIDLDGYVRGPYRNSMGRMFGSDRFMAPEEYELGETIDSRTTAFVMARAGTVLLPDPPARIAAVLREATTSRFRDHPSFHAAWRSARALVAQPPPGARP